MSVKLSSTPVIKRTYQEFKKYAENRFDDNNREELLEDLLAYANRYKQLITGKSSIKEIEPALTRLLFFEATVTRPFLLEVLRLSEPSGDNEPVLSTDDIVEILSVVESYLFRRQICDIPTNALNKIFATLHNDIMQIDKTINDYVEKMKYLLINRHGSGLFPDNTMFLDSLSNKQVYLMRPKNKQYIMDRYENWGTKETKNVYELVADGTYSIEHIMPQTLSHEWQKSLGADWKSIHETWLHRLANLTLTAYNATYQNNTFQRKRDMPKGFKESGLRMNQRLSRYAKWGPEELNDRNNIMLERALKIWPMAETVYVPEKKMLDKVALADEFPLTGRQISIYEFLGASKSVNSWKEMYLDIIGIIFDIDPQPLLNLVDSEENQLSYQVENHQKDTRYEKLAVGLYVNANTSTDTKIYGLQQIFDLYGLDENELIFTLRPQEGE